MKVLRITDLSSERKDRKLYELLELLDSFTMLECRNAKDLNLKDCSETLILDHFDESKGPEQILDVVLKQRSKFRLLVLIDSDQRFKHDLPNDVIELQHITFAREHHSFTECSITLALALIRNNLRKAA